MDRRRRPEPGPRLVVLGSPGAGKGTQCALLARHYGVPHISTGDLLRAAVRTGDEKSVAAGRHMDAGNLLDDDVVVAIVEERLGADDAGRGFVLDGFPRTVPQVDALLEMAGPEGIDVAIDLQVPAEVARARLAQRWTADSDERRRDDAEAVVARRLELHAAQAAPVAAAFDRRGLLVAVDGLGPPEEVAQRLLAVVESVTGTGP